MKRSGGVTAAAVVLIVGSSLLVLMAGMVGLLPLLPQPANEQNPFGVGFFYFEAVFILAVAGWGIATAVGILRLRNWARISILVISGIAVAMLLFSGLSMLLIVPMLRREPGMPAGAIAVFAAIELIFLCVPLGIAIWWLVLFCRRSVRAQFGKGVQSAVLHPIDAKAVPIVAMAEPPRSFARKIPVSTVVIAVFLLVGVAFAGLTVPLVIRMSSPSLLFGVLIRGRGGLVAIIVIAAIQLVLGIALLRRKTWSLDATVAYVVVVTLNGVLFLVSNSREAYFKVILSNYEAPPGLPPDFFPHLMRTIVSSSMAFGILLNFVALYFLWTRREAYRLACEAKG